MPKIVFLPNQEHCPEGAVLEAQEGETILDVALRNGIEIEHACENLAHAQPATASFAKVLTRWMKAVSWKTTCWIRRGA